MSDPPLIHVCELMKRSAEALSERLFQVETALADQLTLPAATRISPASTTDQKQHENNDQYSIHSLSSIIGVVDSLRC